MQSWGSAFRIGSPSCWHPPGALGAPSATEKWTLRSRPSVYPRPHPSVYPLNRKLKLVTCTREYA